MTKSLLTKTQFLGYLMMFIYVVGHAINGTLIDNILDGDLVTLFISFGFMLVTFIIVTKYFRAKNSPSKNS